MLENLLRISLKYGNVNLKVGVVGKAVFYIRYKVWPFVKTYFKILMQYNGIFSNDRLKTWTHCSSIYSNVHQ